MGEPRPPQGGKKPYSMPGGTMRGALLRARYGYGKT